MIMTLMFMGVSLYLEQGLLNWSMSLICAIMAVGVIVFNNYQYYRIAVVMHFLLSGLPMLIFSLFFGLENGFFLYILAFPASMATFIDMENKQSILLTSTYYLLLLIIVCGLFHFNLDNILHFTKSSYVLYINITFTLIVIFILVYNFYLTNTAYQKEIEQKNEDLQTSKNEIEATNIILTHKNKEIEELVSELNDKVKNNLQIISFFTDFDSLNPPTNDIIALLLLQKSRIKVLNLSYQLIFEDHISDDSWFSVFLKRYYSFIQVNYAKKIPNFTVSSITITKKPLISKKRFEALMLILNEWNFRVLDRLPESSEVEISVNIDEAQNAELHKYSLIVHLKGHVLMEAVVDDGLLRLSRARQINMESSFNPATKTHQLQLLF